MVRKVYNFWNEGGRTGDWEGGRTCTGRRITIIISLYKCFFFEEIEETWAPKLVPSPIPNLFH